MTAIGDSADTTDWVDLLAGDRALLDRTSTAERVADVLRQRIIEGALPPGTRLSEENAGRALSVSRNTLREAFRLLGHERLLVHEFHRGVFVRVLTADDIVDLYRTRRVIETSAIRYFGESGTDTSGRLDAISAAVRAARKAAKQARWLDVGTENMRFHLAVTALAGSPRLDDIMRQVAAELRLGFHVMSAPREFHEPYIELNGDIADSLAAGEVEAAERKLGEYLTTAEAQLVAAYRASGS